MSDLLDNTSVTTVPMKKLPGQGSILAGGIISIPFCLGIIGIILAIVTVINATKAINTYNADPDAYFESSIKRVRAGRVCAIVSLSLLVLGIIIIALLVAAGGI